MFNILDFSGAWASILSFLGFGHKSQIAKVNINMHDAHDSQIAGNDIINNGTSSKQEKRYTFERFVARFPGAAKELADDLSGNQPATSLVILQSSSHIIGGKGCYSRLNEDQYPGITSGIRSLESVGLVHAEIAGNYTAWYVLDLEFQNMLGAWRVGV
jgi:hypothetical protein